MCGLVLLPAFLACGRPEASPERQAEVAARGAQVMPFDLSRTTHVFEDLPDGGLQTVTANDAGDTLQVRLIREHLEHEVRRFTAGDFSDPMAIHGADMPGVAELRAGAEARQIRIEYAPIEPGGTIRYTALQPSLVAGLHRWFGAQRADHGAHAR
ncbi:MAG: aspartate carbamoyltransferase [Gemmatimonadales bacterium]